MRTKWYDILFTEEDNRLPNAFQRDEDNLFDGAHYYLCQGEWRRDWNQNAFYRSTSAEHDGPPEDIILDLSIPVYSPRFRQALEAAKVGTKDVQYLPIHLIKSTGERIQGHAIANVLTRVEALDRERCFMLCETEEIDPATGKPEVAGNMRIALHSEPLHGHDIIRLREFWPPVLVSHRFAEIFWDLKCTGCRLTEVEVDRSFTSWKPR